MWQLESSSHLPKYQQIMQLIEQKLQHGALQPGERLPTERGLAAELKVNRSTVKRAFAELVANGTIRAHHGSGHYLSTTLSRQVYQPQTNWQHYMKQSQFLPIDPYLEQLRQRKQTDGQVTDFASGDLPLRLTPNIDLPQLSWPTIIAEEQQADPTGYAPLKVLIANLFATRSTQPVKPEQLLITSGSQQALYLITQCLLSPGDAIAVEAPSYLYSLALFKGAGIRIYPLPMAQSNNWQPQLEALYKKHRIKMVFVNPMYQNPTGNVLSQQGREALIKTCSQLHIPIVEDDPYGLLTPEQAPLYQLAPENVIYIGSLSKTAGSTTRIGWLCAPPTVIQRLATARSEMEFGLGILPQVMAHHLMSSPTFASHLQTLALTMQETQQRFQTQLREQFGNTIVFNPTQGGYHLWVKQSFCTKPAQYHGLLQSGLLLMPGTLFGGAATEVRLSVINRETSDNAEAVRRLKQALFAMKTSSSAIIEGQETPRDGG